MCTSTEGSWIAPLGAVVVKFPLRVVPGEYRVIMDDSHVLVMKVKRPSIVVAHQVAVPVDGKRLTAFIRTFGAPS